MKLGFITVLLLLLLGCATKFETAIANATDRRNVSAFLKDTTLHNLMLVEVPFNRTKKVYSIETCKVLSVTAHADSVFWGVVTKGRLYISYFHLQKTHLKKGDQVKRNQLIGFVENDTVHSHTLQLYMTRKKLADL